MEEAEDDDFGDFVTTISVTQQAPLSLPISDAMFQAKSSYLTKQYLHHLNLSLKNKTGFIKVFSGSPIAFTSGFCQVNRIMQNLFVCLL